jgi:hypothetical protein
MRAGIAPTLLCIAAHIGCASPGSTASVPLGDAGDADASQDDSQVSLPGDSSSGSGDGGTEGSSDAGAPLDGALAMDSALPSGRSFPDTTSTIAIFSDQLPTMTQAQLQFAAAHYVGTQKQLLPVTQALRAINPNFLVLHYHLAMWQSAPSVTFIVDGGAWGNDYPAVTTHEDWFWHNDAGERVPSNADGKLLMNVSVAEFASYWADSLEQQVSDGDYDGVFLDSASPALLQGECGGIDPRLSGTAVKSTAFSELGGATWIAAWETWIAALDATLGTQGIPLIPNTSAFTTTWDNSNYGLTRGIFAEGFAGTGFAPADWQASTNELLALAQADKLMILQNYLQATDDVATRLYYLGNYLLVKGKHTYLDYFATTPLEWYPEWTIDLGAPASTPSTVADLITTGGVYRRDYAKGSVLLNPTGSPVTVIITGNQVAPSGGGAVDGSGSMSGALNTTPVTSVTLGSASAAIVVH